VESLSLPLAQETPVTSAEIDQILQANARAPFGGLAGEKMVNVLEVILEVR